jgi:hypothetical protein
MRMPMWSSLWKASKIESSGSYAQFLSFSSSVATIADTLLRLRRWRVPWWQEGEGMVWRGVVCLRRVMGSWLHIWNFLAGSALGVTVEIAEDSVYEGGCPRPALVQNFHRKSKQETLQHAVKVPTAAGIGCADGGRRHRLCRRWPSAQGRRTRQTSA